VGIIANPFGKFNLFLSHAKAPLSIQGKGAYRG